MQVRLIEGMFRSDIFDFEITENGLVFSKEGKKIVIPFGEIRHFNMEGRGKKLKHFVLESTEKDYEGSFLNAGDADRAIAGIREQCGCYVDIRLDME